MTDYRKKLIEVAIPLAEINDASAYDKMPGIGPHPKGIHHWWARLPLPCARAVIFASLVDDPASDPKIAKGGAKAIERERERLFGLITDLIQKKPHENPAAFEAAAQEIKKHCDGKIPSLLDPFSGGGSIPLEGHRLGLPSIGYDLNPVAVLISKAQIEFIPRFLDRPPVRSFDEVAETSHLLAGRWKGSKGLAEDVRYYGEWMRQEAQKRLGHLYPKIRLPKEHGGGEANVIAWLWARTVKCPNPACGAEMPLISSFWLSKKKGKQAWIEPAINKKAKSVEFAVITGTGIPQEPTKSGRGAIFKCLVCESITEDAYTKAEGNAGRIGNRLLAIAAEGRRGRVYLAPENSHEQVVEKLAPSWRPSGDMPENPRWFSPPAFGMKSFSDLFTPRQLVALTTLCDLISEARKKVLADAKISTMPDDGKSLDDGGIGTTAYADAVSLFLALTIDRLADFNCALSRWKSSGEQQMQLFGRQAIPMVWDFAEANILGNKGITWTNAIKMTTDSIEVIPTTKSAFAGAIHQYDAAGISSARLPQSVIVSTDPPYYDNIGYADLSDFFYVWLRRSLKDRFPQLFSTLLVPKAPELVATPYRFGNSREKAKEHFESGFKRAFAALKKSLDPRFPMTVYYAFKQSEDSDDDDGDSGGVDITTGWETLLESLISTGFQITATWPIRASQKWRMVSMGTNALASYIVLACRPRPDDAPLATRKELLAALKRELPDALRNLQHGNIAPVDLAQAALGPGMAVFSRYAKVVEADGSSMSIRTALGIINQILDETLSEQEGDFDPDTRWALDWFQEFGTTTGDYGRAETLATAKAISVQGLVDSGILHSRAGKVRLLKREELNSEWDPTKDARLTVWEVTQQLVRALKTGEQNAADLLRKVGGLGETARELAYRLFILSERKNWAQDALDYNSLVVAWSELKRLSTEKRAAPELVQESLLITPKKRR